MSNTNFAFILLLCLSLSCKLEEDIIDNTVKNDDGVIIDLPFKWQVDVSDEDYCWANLIPHRYENVVVVAGSRSSKSHYLKGIDITNGETLYTWEKLDNTGPIWFDDYSFNQSNGSILLQDYDNTTYFDILNGEIQWSKKEENMSLAYNSFIYENDFYFTAFQRENDIDKPYLIKGDLASGETNLLTSPDISEIQQFNSSYGTISPPYIFRKDNDLFAFYGYTENLDLYNNNSSFGYVDLYNLSKDEYAYQKKKVGDTLYLHFVDRPLIIDNIAITNASDQLFGIDINTGETIWTQDNFQNNGEGTFTYERYGEDFIGVNVGGFIQRIISIDPKTGNTNWEIIDKAGDAEQIFILKNYLFFVGRGDGLLYVFDLDTQKLLLKLKSPDQESFQAYAGMRPFLIDGEIKLIIGSYLNAYCYDLKSILK